MSKIEISKNNRGDYTAEINLNKVSSYAIGNLYNYGDTEEQAKQNLFVTAKVLLDDLEKIIREEDKYE